MIGDYSCMRCVTIWGSILDVLHIKGDLVTVCGPNTVDAGQDIGTRDIQTMWKISLYKDFPHPQHGNEYWAKNWQYF